MSNDNVIPFPGATTPAGSANVTDLQRWIASLGPSWKDPFAPEPLKLLRKRSKKAAYVVRIDLDGARPPIWRRLRLASDLTLDRMHDIMQNAMGWTDSHLHHFIMGPDSRDFRRQHFLSAYDIEEGDEGIPESDVRLDQVLAKPGHRLFYEYDFGDGWVHTIKLEKVEPWVEGDPDAVCLTGRRACPPEDIGGLGGFYEALEILAGRTDGVGPEWVERILDWFPPGYDEAAFSVDEVNDALTAEPLSASEIPPILLDLLVKTGASPLSPVAALVRDALASPPLAEAQVADAVRGYQLLLDEVGDGLTLTQAGYLPPRIVEALFTQLGMDDRWIGKGNREDMTLPVLELRESATALGLLRKAKGKLTLTAVARRLSGNPSALMAHISSRLPLGKRHEADAGSVALLFIAAGGDWYPSLSDAAEIMDSIGWGVTNGRLDRALNEWSRPTMSVVHILAGRLTTPEHRAAVARTLLQPRAQ